MCKFSSKFGGVPFQPLGDLTWNELLANHDTVHTSSLQQSSSLKDINSVNSVANYELVTSFSYKICKKTIKNIQF